MKKVTLLLLMVFLSVFCSACSNADIESKKLEISRENVKLNNISETYLNNIEVVDNFNALVIDYSVNKNTDDLTFDFFKYSGNNQDFKGLLDNIFEELNKPMVDSFGEVIEYPFNFGVAVEAYPFIDETTGEIIDYVVISKNSTIYRIVINWKNGKYVNYYFE